MKKLLVTIALLSLSLQVLAEESLPDRLIMMTDSGRILLDNKKCDQVNENGFLWSANATEYISAYTGSGMTIHKACWQEIEGLYFIWFYEEDPTFIVKRERWFFKKESEINLYH